MNDRTDASDTAVSGEQRVEQTSSTDRATQIQHPIWCRTGEDGPELSEEHVGREYCLETVDFDDTLTVAPVQLYELTAQGQQIGQLSEVRLSIVNQDIVDSAATTHLSAADVDRLIAMLTRAKSDIELEGLR